MSTRTTDCIDENAGLWSVALRKDSGWNVRTTVLRLNDDSLALISPTQGLQEEIAKLGTPSILLAPNYFHHMGVSGFMEKWPEAKAIASEGAIPRLKKKSDVESFGELQLLREKLPGHAQLLEAPGLKNGEVMLRVETDKGIAWAVSDAFFNMADHVSGMMGVVVRLTGTSKGLRIGKTFTKLAVADRTLYGDWMRKQLEADKPSILIPGHGEVLSENATEKIDELLRTRLRA